MLSIPNGNLEGKALSFEIWEHCSGKTNWKSYFFLENQQHIYHHEGQKEYREFSFCLTVFLKRFWKAQRLLLQTISYWNYL